ncbi:MAG: TonB-dependent receptor [Gammaproteobacteria bacterium]|nr:TonB-dependent receptor [Gammaproteobacteria bacterium]
MKSMTKTLGKYTYPALAALVLSLGAAGASADGAEVLTLDIKPQQAGSALMELAGSSGVQILVSDEAGADIEVEGLTGEYRFEEALAAMLTNTGLEYEFASANLVLVQQAQEDEDADSDAAFEEPVMAEDEAPLELEKQVVTGSRLEGGDASARVYSYTAEDIAVRGVSSIEEFFRTLPWAFPSITTQSNMSYDTPGSEYAAGSDSRDEKWDQLGLGVSTVNLRALGSANTLVLVNGRRVAGKAGEEDDFANILTIPLSAIERVDIQLDGASAVYGSDAIGGVVNFITRKDWQGLAVSYRHEYSSTDADHTKASITGGYAWGSGSVTAILSRDTSEPITNAKTGWSSSDFRGYLGPEFDLRSTANSQPGVVCEVDSWPWSPHSLRCPYSWQNIPRYQLPAGHSGVGATVDDFVTIAAGEDPPTLLDWVLPQNGADSTRESVTVNLEQYVTDDLRVFADFRRSKLDSYQEWDIYVGFLPVPASNAYNPFGRSVGVLYTPLKEYQDGTWPAQYTESTTTERQADFGLIWTFADSHELTLEATRTESEREAYRMRARTTRPRWDPTADAFYAALSSSDPNTAINPFGDGTAPGGSLADFLVVGEGPVEGGTEKRNYNLTLRGSLFNLWGGPVSYAAGAERREEYVLRTVINSNSLNPWLGEYTKQDSGSAIGVDRPSREITAYYVELSVPLIGPENARPGLESLTLSLAARRDEYQSAGAHYIQIREGYQGFQWVQVEYEYWHPDNGWNTAIRNTPVFSYARSEDDPNITGVKQSRTSPRVGFRYQPTSTFTLRGRWSRSFKPPVWSELFSATDSGLQRQRRYSSPYFDPYAPGGPADIRAFYVISSYNPTLKNEFSDNYSVGFDWTPSSIPGLQWTADWYKVDFTNKIAHSSSFIRNNPELVFNNPDIVERDEEGNAVQVYHWPVNLDEKYSEMVQTGLQYTFESAFGRFTPRINYTRVLEEYMRLTEDAPILSDLGTQNGSNKYQLQGSLSWTRGNMAADLFIYYTPAYLNDGARYCSYNVRQIPGSRCGESDRYIELGVSSLTTVDLTVTYRFDNGLRVRAGGRNILDRAAPVTLSGSSYPYDPTRWDARGQVFFVDLNWEI